VAANDEGVRTMTYKDPAKGHYQPGQPIGGGGDYGMHPDQLGNTHGDTFWLQRARSSPKPSPS
jgi:hypothetical protein